MSRIDETFADQIFTIFQGIPNRSRLELKVSQTWLNINTGLEIWSSNFCPSIGPNGGSVAKDSGGEIRPEAKKNTLHENCSPVSV
jgi:hypothetical protein